MDSQTVTIPIRVSQLVDGSDCYDSAIDKDANAVTHLFCFSHPVCGEHE